MPASAQNRGKRLGLAKMLWWRARPDSAPEADGAGSVRKIISLTRSLMSDRGDVAGGPIAADILGLFKTLDQSGRQAFFELLVKDFSPNPDDVGRAADAYRLDPSPAHLRELQEVVEPPRQELFRRLNMAPEGTRELIEIRR